MYEDMHALDNIMTMKIVATKNRIKEHRSQVRIAGQAGLVVVISALVVG
jgi:hypothetical protein